MLTDKLALRWQFESATKEFQDKYWKQMLDEFVACLEVEAQPLLDQKDG